MVRMHVSSTDVSPVATRLNRTPRPWRSVGAVVCASSLIVTSLTPVAAHQPLAPTGLRAVSQAQSSPAANDSDAGIKALDAAIEQAAEDGYSAVATFCTSTAPVACILVAGGVLITVVVIAGRYYLKQRRLSAQQAAQAEATLQEFEADLGQIQNPVLQQNLQNDMNQMEYDGYVLESDLSSISESASDLEESMEADAKAGLKQPSANSQKAFNELQSNVQQYQKDFSAIQARYDEIYRAGAFDMQVFKIAQKATINMKGGTTAEDAKVQAADDIRTAVALAEKQWEVFNEKRLKIATKLRLIQEVQLRDGAQKVPQYSKLDTTQLQEALQASVEELLPQALESQSNSSASNSDSGSSAGDDSFDDNYITCELLGGSSGMVVPFGVAMIPAGLPAAGSDCTEPEEPSTTTVSESDQASLEQLGLNDVEINGMASLGMPVSSMQEAAGVKNDLSVQTVNQALKLANSTISNGGSVDLTVTGDSGSFTRSDALVAITPGANGGPPTITDITPRVKTIAKELDVDDSAVMNGITETGTLSINTTGTGTDPNSFTITSNDVDEIQGISGITTTIDTDPQYASVVKQITDWANFANVDPTVALGATTQVYEQEVQRDPSITLSDVANWLITGSGTPTQQQAMQQLISNLPSGTDPTMNPAEIASNKGYINGPSDTKTVLTSEQQLVVQDELDDNESKAENEAADDALDVLHGE